MGPESGTVSPAPSTCTAGVGSVTVTPLRGANVTRPSRWGTEWRGCCGVLLIVFRGGAFPVQDVFTRTEGPLTPSAFESPLRRKRSPLVFEPEGERNYRDEVTEASLRSLGGLSTGWGVNVSPTPGSMVLEGSVPTFSNTWPARST